MALNELMETFETLKKRIEEHSDYLSGGGGAETRTRQVLIDPLLKELGWDVGDPNQVELELPVDEPWGRNRKLIPDYTLKHDGNVVAVVEAKALSKGKLNDANAQAYDYADSQGIKYAFATDGDEWRLIDVQGGGKREDRAETLFTITKDPPSACALRALLLWNPNLGAEHGPVEAVEPVAIVENETEGLDEKTPPPVVNNDHREWHKLSRDLPTGGPPTCVRFNGAETEAGSWSGMYVSIGELLVKNGLLTADRVPVESKSGKSILVSNDEARFRSKRQIAPGMYVNGHGGPGGLIPRSVDLCEALGIDPALFEVCFE